MPASTSLAEGFPRATRADWERLAARGGEDGIARLGSRSADGIRLEPVYAPGSGPVIPGRLPGSAWTVVERIDDGGPAAVRDRIAAARAGGATGIELVFAASGAAYGRGIDPDLDVGAVTEGLDMPVRIDAGPHTLRLAAAVRAPLVHDVFDPLASQATADPTLDLDASFAAIAGRVAADGPGTAFAADGRLWHNAGATEAQELGLALAAAVDTLRHLAAGGVPIAASIQRLGLTLAADADQFLTIAKLRAARLLLARLGELIATPSRPPVHAETSWRMLGRSEPSVNMLRETTAAFAAATGGADSITVLPPLFAADAFSARMARNVQTILIEEASLARAVDPGAGAGAVEEITAGLAAAGWAFFTGIEAAGGLRRAIAAGSVLEAVRAARDARLEGAASGAIPLVGVNANVDRTTPTPPPEARPAPAAALRPVRLAAPFEAVAAQVARTPLAFLRLPGTAWPELGDALAGLGFAVEPFATAEAAAAQRCPAACIVTGAEGPSDALAAAARLRDAGTAVLLVAAPASDPALARAFDVVVTPGADLVAAAAHLVDRIAKSAETVQNR